MIRKAKFIFSALILLCILSGYCIAQQSKTDSLLLILKSATNDTVKIKTCFQLCNITIYSEPDKARQYALKALEAAETLDNKKHSIDAYRAIGNTYYYQSNYPKAMEYYRKSLEMSRQSNNKKSEAWCLKSIGIVYDLQANYPKAIEYYQKSLQLSEEIKDTLSIAKCLNNIGVVHVCQENYQRAIEYYQESLKLKEKMGDMLSVSITYNNIGNVYVEMERYNEAMANYRKSYQLSKKIGDTQGEASALFNIGFAYYNQEEYDKALKNYQKSLVMVRKMGDEKRVAQRLNAIAQIHLKNKNYEKAADYCEQSIAIAKEINAKAELQDGYRNIAKAYQKMGNFDKAYQNLEDYITVHDSIFNEKTMQQLQELEVKYQTEKKQQQIALQKTQIEKKNIEIKQRRTQNYALISGIMLVLALGAVAMYSRHRIKQAKSKIKLQKEKIEEAHIQITDSITYASRIQKAMLPKDTDFEQENLDYFVFWKPRDVVSGDFYWMRRVNDNLLIAVADCTGHGVPGAFVSMLGMAFLNDIVAKSEITRADEALNKLREQIKKALHQKGTPGERKDGMDIAFCAINTKTNHLQFAGAYNPLYVIRNQNNETKLIELKADKQPIAIYFKEKPFKNHEFDLRCGDTLYMFSDGFVDQHGGDKKRKFLKKNFKKLLLSIQNKPMQEQKSILDQTMNQWIGNNYKQVDDMLVLGIKIHNL